MKLTFCLLAVAVLFGSACAASAQAPVFEVASVRPAPPDADPNSGHWSPPGIGQFQATHLSLAQLVHLAYGVEPRQIVHQPSWFESCLYDVDAKPEPGIRLSRDELRPRLQQLLAQRFHLVVRTETRFALGYALTVPKDGTHLTPTKGDHFSGFRVKVSRGKMRGYNWTMTQLAAYLTSVSDFSVKDETGLAGAYDIDFTYNPAPDAVSDLLPLDAALKQATGLILKPSKIPGDVLVIDSVDRTPTPN